MKIKRNEQLPHYDFFNYAEFYNHLHQIIIQPKSAKDIRTTTNPNLMISCCACACAFNMQTLT